MDWTSLLSHRTLQSEASSDSPFPDDYHAIIRSPLFRRLQDKAQVFPLDHNDYVRTRLTHSLEVSAIGKRLGEVVFRKIRQEKLDAWLDTQPDTCFSDILLCAGLIHDIGNPPFGHFGEYAIQEWFQKNLAVLTFRGTPLSRLLTPWQLQDLCSFEGNAQSLRLLCKTLHPANAAGLSLSCAVLGAAIKYPVSSRTLRSTHPDSVRKFGYFYSEQHQFQQLCRILGTGGKRHPLSWLLEAADDIAYRTSDLEDALVKKVICFPRLSNGLFPDSTTGDSPESAVRQAASCIDHLHALYQDALADHACTPELTALQKWSQQLQTIMIQDAGNAFLHHYDAIMDGSWQGDLFAHTVSGHLIQAVSALSEAHIYTSSTKTRPELFGRHVMHALLSQFIPAALVYDTDIPAPITDTRIMDTVSDIYKSVYHREAQGKNESEKLYLRILMITDYLSGMTDHYAKQLYQELFG